MGLGNEWEKLELLETRRIQNNLIKIALNRTSHQELTEEHYTAIEGELMDYLHSHNRFISVVTSNLNHTTYSVKTQYIKDIISALRIYKKYKDIATMPAEELLKITEKKNRIKNINQEI